jgi:hypothetical protein
MTAFDQAVEGKALGASLSGRWTALIQQLLNRFPKDRGSQRLMDTLIMFTKPFERACVDAVPQHIVNGGRAYGFAALAIAKTS